jgi:hypothetical protein
VDSSALKHAPTMGQIITSSMLWMRLSDADPAVFGEDAAMDDQVRNH